MGLSILMSYSLIDTSLIMGWRVRLGVALGKGEVGDCPRPLLKIRLHPKIF